MHQTRHSLKLGVGCIRELNGDDFVFSRTYFLLQSLIAWRNAASNFSPISLVSNVNARFMPSQRWRSFHSGEERYSATMRPGPRIACREPRYQTPTIQAHLNANCDAVIQLFLARCFGEDFTSLHPCAASAKSFFGSICTNSFRSSTGGPKYPGPLRSRRPW